MDWNYKYTNMAVALQFTFKTFLDDSVTGLRTYYEYTADYDALGALNSFEVRDLAGSVIVPSAEDLATLQADSLKIYNKGGTNPSDELLISDMDYPSVGEINDYPTSHGGGVGS